MKELHVSIRVCVLLWTVAVAMVPAGPASGQEVTAIKARTVWTGAGKPIPNGVVLIRDGKIMDVGPVDKGEIPADARVVDLGSGFLMPGLVNPYSRLGVSGRAGAARRVRGASSTRFTNKADANPAAELFPRQRVFKELREAGITTLGLVPGSGGGITGTVAVIRPQGANRTAMILEDAAMFRI